ncbi:phosphate ABC transporter permease PstA [bacterium]|nr:phosphate ABC transporter permease PstA [bacterium]
MGDRLLAGVCWLAAGIVAGGFAWLLGDIVMNGLGQINLMYLLMPVADAGRAGGIGPVIVSTSLILVVCLSVSLPLGLATAIVLSEADDERWFGRLVRRSLDVLAGVPSIVFGLFGYAVFGLALGLGFSILSGGLTLACMVLPILIRSIEQGLRAVPIDIRHAAAALGMQRWRTLVAVLLPAAAPGVLVGVVLGIGRAAAETAALLFTSGYVARMPDSLLDSGRSLSVHIFDLALNVAGGEPRAYAAALVLIVALAVVNLTAISLSERLLSSRINPA